MKREAVLGVLAVAAAAIGLFVVRWAHTSVNPFDEAFGNEVVVSPVALTIGWGLVAVGAICLLAALVGLVTRD